MPGRPGDDSDNHSGYQDWPHDLDSLQNIGEEILKTWQNQEPKSPRDYPTVRWLTNNGYSNLRWILRKKHNMGVKEFFILLTSAGGQEEYQWHIDNVRTISLAKNYLDDRVECRGWRRRTKLTHRSRLNNALRRFSDIYGDCDIVAYASDPSLQTDLYTTFKRVVKDLRVDLTSQESAFKYLRATHRFLLWLERSGRIKYDPMEGLEDEFSWAWTAEPTPLTGNQVAQLWNSAETDEERVLIIGYCVWGVRTSELPAVHINQLQFDQNTLLVSFEEEQRKNGEGKVSLLVGLDTLANLLDKRERQPTWNGYLFPSPKTGREVLCPNQVRKKFKDLCRRAGVTINNKTPTPKHGRSFYYNILADAETELLDMIAQIADEQGSKDIESVHDYYLTEERRDRYRRIFFRHKIRDILPDDAFTDSSDGFDGSLSDFE